MICLLSGVAAGVTILAAVAGTGSGIAAIGVVVGSGGRRRLAGSLGGGIRLLLLQRPVAGDILVVVLQRRGKDMAAIAVGDEIEIVGLRRVGDRFQRRAARAGDRRRRQALDQIGVVRRLLVDVGLVDRPVGGFALAAEQA